jgi:hypothetical protein
MASLNQQYIRLIRDTNSVNSRRPTRNRTRTLQRASDLFKLMDPLSRLLLLNQLSAEEVKEFSDYWQRLFSN